MKQRKQVAEVPLEVAAHKKDAPDVKAGSIEMLSHSYRCYSAGDYLTGAKMLKTIAANKKLWLAGDESTGWKGWNVIVSATKAVYDMLRDSRDAAVDKLDQARERYERAMSDWMVGQDAKDQAREKEAATRILELEKSDNELDRLEAQMIAMTTIPSARPSMEGVVSVTSYDFEITDMEEFLRDVLLNKALPLEGEVKGKVVSLLEVRESLLQELRKSVGENFHVKGLKVTPRKSFRVSA